MREKLWPGLGIAATLVYGAFILWLYATEPRSLREAATNTTVAAGTYQVDKEQFTRGLTLFRQEQFRAAREEWQRADPAQKDALTQFYTAYAFYREGWGRAYHDDALYKQGLEATQRALALNDKLTVDDPDLQIKTPAELKAELEAGLTTTTDDFNPLKVFRQRR
jgi:tetratricopeptide (TPR) repeat protein